MSSEEHLEKQHEPNTINKINKTKRGPGNRSITETYELLKIIFSYENYINNMNNATYTKSPVIATETYLIEHGYNIGYNSVKRLLKTYDVKYDKNNNIKYIYLKNL